MFKREMVIIPIEPSEKIRQVMQALTDTLNEKVPDGTWNTEVITALLFVLMDCTSDFTDEQQANITQSTIGELIRDLAHATGCKINPVIRDLQSTKN
jgi:hypothetical protein